MEGRRDPRRPSGLYRETLGEYLFAGRPQVRFNARLGLHERFLLDAHEHDHWEHAHATVFGNEQIALTEAIRWFDGSPTALELDACRRLTVEASQLVYEGCALVTERSLLEHLGEGAPPAWNDLLGLDVYGEALELFDRWLRLLPYATRSLRSIASNCAELCLDAVSFLDAGTETDTEGRGPIEAREPTELSSAALGKLLKQRSPDAVLRALSAALAAQPEAFVAAYDAQVSADATLAAAGVTSGYLRGEHADPSLRALARLSYVTYEALRGFGLATGAVDLTMDHSVTELVCEHRLADWHQRLWAGHLSGTLSHPGIPFGAPSDGELQLEVDFFTTILTAASPPQRDPAADLDIGSWGPVHDAFGRNRPDERKLYVSIRPAPDDGNDRDPRFSLSSARALIDANDGFAWKFGASRYRLDVPRSGLRDVIADVTRYNPALAVPYDLFDAERGCVDVLGPLPDNITVGVLLEHTTVEEWAEIVELATSNRPTMTHVYAVGPTDATFAVTFAVEGSARWFLYLPTTLSMHRRIDRADSAVLRIPGHRAAMELDEVPMTRRFQLASVLICEQYARNGL